MVNFVPINPLAQIKMSASVYSRNRDALPPSTATVVLHRPSHSRRRAAIRSYHHPRWSDALPLAAPTLWTAFCLAVDNLATALRRLYAKANTTCTTALRLLCAKPCRRRRKALHRSILHPCRRRLLGYRRCSLLGRHW